MDGYTAKLMNMVIAGFEDNEIWSEKVRRSSSNMKPRVSSRMSGVK